MVAGVLLYRSATGRDLSRFCDSDMVVNIMMGTNQRAIDASAQFGTRRFF